MNRYNNLLGDMTNDQWFKMMEKKTMFIVWPCSGFEHLCLWEQESTKHKWESGTFINTYRFGELGDKVLEVQVQFDTIDGCVVAFVDIHMTYDYTRMEYWLSAKFPNVPKQDPMNFSHCIHAIKRKKDER